MCFYNHFSSQQFSKSTISRVKISNIISKAIYSLSKILKLANIIIITFFINTEIIEISIVYKTDLFSPEIWYNLKKSVSAFKIHFSDSKTIYYETAKYYMLISFKPWSQQN